jgi:succinate-semialdehyde dehydrogenase / glutarate-semialdehyde dehydrogenase
VLNPADESVLGTVPQATSSDLDVALTAAQDGLRAWRHISPVKRAAGAVQLVRAFQDAGVPAGVLNLVFGTPSEISEYLIPQPAVRLVTFPGSIPVGKRLAALAGQHMKPAIMELGGHAPVVGCDDVDPAASAATSVIGKSRNAGQVCVSPTRFYVQEAI